MSLRGVRAYDTFSDRGRMPLTRSLGQQAAMIKGIGDVERTVRNAAEEPMLTHVGFLDFLSKGSVAW